MHSNLFSVIGFAVLLAGCSTAGGDRKIASSDESLFETDQAVFADRLHSTTKERGSVKIPDILPVGTVVDVKREFELTTNPDLYPNNIQNFQATVFTRGVVSGDGSTTSPVWDPRLMGNIFGQTFCQLQRRWIPGRPVLPKVQSGTRFKIMKRQTGWFNIGTRLAVETPEWWMQMIDETGRVVDEANYVMNCVKGGPSAKKMWQNFLKNPWNDDNYHLPLDELTYQDVAVMIHNHLRIVTP